MAFKLIISDTVTVPVKGFMTDETGRQQPVEFRLTCKRKRVSELKQADAARRQVGSPEPFDPADFMRDVTTGWHDMLDAAGQPLAFSVSGLDELLDIPGIAQIAFASYARENGAREKN